jgi:hypothetical protein
VVSDNVQVFDRNEFVGDYDSTKTAMKDLLESYTFAELEQRFVVVESTDTATKSWHPKWIRRTVGERELSSLEWSTRGWRDKQPEAE